MKRLKRLKIFRSVILNYTLITVAILAIGFLTGWKVKEDFFIAKSSAQDVSDNQGTALRLSGYKFISPLLVCDTNTNKQAKQFIGLEKKLQDLVNQEIDNKNITTASVYFRDIQTGGQVDINPNEQYFPASLNKIPIMMSYYKKADSNPQILDQKIEVSYDKNNNDIQEIKPPDEAKNGRKYSTEELIEKMIKYSDNNAYFSLEGGLDKQEIATTYDNLKIPFIPNQSEGPDFMTPASFSYFLRVLYNATYLSNELSEKALGLLAQVDFKDGIVAGLPANINVAHKFGLVSYVNNGVVQRREMHDCGIIYSGSNPYLLCVMTKSTANIPHV